MTYDNPFSLEGKTVLDTGASSGIGKSIAIVCSRMGAKVIITGRNRERLQVTMSELVGSGHISSICELTNSSELKEFVAKLPLLYGIVHCAGIGQRILCKQLSEEDVDRVMDVNFKAPVLLQTELLKQKKVAKL